MRASLSRGLALLVLAIATAWPAQAGPISQAIDILEIQLMGLVHLTASVVGPLLMLVGGGRAAWIAYRGEEWVWPFIQAILGTAIFAAAA